MTTAKTSRKRKATAARRAKARAKTKALVERSNELLASYTDAELETHPAAATFARYSVRNQLLIWSQNPDATDVAGFHEWKKRGRMVRKGEHGIQILAPVPYVVEREDGETEQRMSFKTATVFDVSQTVDLPAPADK